jgi:hypothetical protein
MDFLDPRRRRSHRRRLKIGYALMSILTALGTMTIIYLAQGYDIDRKTGTLIQNGIVFVDSKPRGAKIFLDGIQQNSRTDTRMDLPAGVYTVRLEADNYRTWERTFNLEGGEIERLVYPFLIPNQLVTTDVAQYDVIPGLATQSPDRRWVIVQRLGQTYQFDLYDLNDPKKASEAILMPPSILTEPSADATLKPIEWSTDNRHVMFERTFGENLKEFILFDRENPQESVNLNAALGIAPVIISMRDKKADQFYYLDAIPGALRIANLKDRNISAPLLSSVINYKSYASDIVLYATQDGVTKGKADFRILEGDKSYTLKQVNADSRYLIEVSKYDDDWYYAVGAASDNLIFVYENPLPALKSQTRTPLIVTAIMRLDNPRFVSFSANTQFIGLQSGNNILTLDLEDNQQYRTNLTHEIPLEQEIEWMDGHRFILSIDQQSFVIDFDGSNLQTLVTSRLNPGPFFDRNYDNVFTFEESKVDGNKKAFTMTVIDN